MNSAIRTPIISGPTYCNRCVLPDTRPGIEIDHEGICSGCRGAEDKSKGIDWAERAKAFDGLVARAKDRAEGYDCVVPVSGGKDSWYQIIKAHEHGLKVLAVTWRTPARTEIGQRNLDGMIKHLGVDHIDYSINPDVERRFMKAAFEELGATALPMHMALFAIPIRLAIQMRIPLVIWGENTQLEYGGNAIERLATRLDAAWLAKHGCLQSTRAADWLGKEGLTEDDLQAYRFPEKPDYDVDSIFLGSFFPWDSFENTRIATQRGFVSGEGVHKVGAWSFADIDCDFISLHHFLKWHKFGITRSFDNFSVEIRGGRRTREAAIAELRDRNWEAPREDIARFCEFQGLSEEWFWSICEKHRNHDIWTKEKDLWIIPGFLIEDWEWSKSCP